MLYIVELAWVDHVMQPSLKVHHIAAITFSAVGFVVTGCITADRLPLLRIFFFFILYAVTEQNVFVLMLIYRLRKKKTNKILLYFLSMTYIFTRMIILCFELWATVVGIMAYEEE